MPLAETDEAQPRLTRSFRECQRSTEVTVNHQPKHRQASPEATMSNISRGNTEFKWGGRGSNPRPTDYESLVETSTTRLNGQLKQRISPAGQHIWPFPVRFRYAFGTATNRP